jgi:hypothetical protein
MLRVRLLVPLLAREPVVGRENAVFSESRENGETYVNCEVFERA